MCVLAAFWDLVENDSFDMKNGMYRSKHIVDVQSYSRYLKPKIKHSNRHIPQRLISYSHL